MKEMFTFDDVLIKPKFSYINSRSYVDLSTRFLNRYPLPIVSSNMDTVTATLMASKMLELGGIGCLHRFWSIDDNCSSFLHVKQYTGGMMPWVSVGISEEEVNRAEVLIYHGAKVMIIDVAMAAQMQVVNFYKRIKNKYPGLFLIVGNFATKESVMDFVYHLGYKPDAIKVGIGPGSACTTRLKTGCGIPQLSAIIECVETKIPVIADGGCKNSGDIAKALAAGADMVMLGGMLAGTDESPGDIIENLIKYKKYRGSASKESYEDQGKDWACSEGESFTVPYKGPVENIIKDIEGGLRSAFTYVGASTLLEFQQKAEFIRITNNSFVEGTAHGKR